MSTKRRIVVAGLNEFLPSDHFDIAEFDEGASTASTAHIDLVIFTRRRTWSGLRNSAHRCART